MSKLALVFPGQGSQFVGMAKDLYENFKISKNLIDRACDSLGFDIRSLMFEGPEEELKQTKNTQPAIFVHSMAVLALLEERGFCFDAALGHSLGEYGALVAAGVTDFDDGLALVKARGAIMQAADFGEEPMAAIMGLTPDQVREACSRVEGFVAEAAILNGPGQIVIAGHPEGVKQASKYATELGAKRAMPLKTSGPFHSSLMIESGEKFGKFLTGYELRDAHRFFIPNTTALITSSAVEIRQNLIDQVSKTVLWEQSVLAAWENGVDTFVEVGPGKVLYGLIRKICRDAKVFAVGDGAGFDELMKALYYRFR